MPNNKTQKSIISKYANQVVRQRDDYIALETPLEIRLGHSQKSFQTLAITMCSPEAVDDLVYGYLFTESIIQQSNDIVSINTFNNELGLIAEVHLKPAIAFEKFLNKRHGMVHASCGVCGKTDFDELLTYTYPTIKETKINASVIQSLPSKLNKMQKAFNKTGGLHASALFNSQGELVLLKEDIGRHNALDKLIGSAIQDGLIPLNGYIVLLSGRVSFELVHKTLMAGASTLAAIGAPSSLSIEIAKLNNMNLVGFVKANELNSYCS